MELWTDGWSEIGRRTREVDRKLRTLSVEVLARTIAPMFTTFDISSDQNQNFFIRCFHLALPCGVHKALHSSSLIFML